MKALTPITLPGDPTADLHAATKAYVDANAGGGASIPVQSTAPATPALNDLWFDTSVVTATPNTITASTADPSGGIDGDIWIKY